MNKHYIIPIFVPHEGCPHDCVFCNQKSITGVQEKVTPESVKETIENYLNTIDHTSSTVEVSFYGGTFTAIPMEKQKSFLHVAKMYKDMGRIKFIRLSTRPDYINIEILENLKTFSVDIIELGVQSLDREVLIKAGRGHSVEDVLEASKLIKEHGFTLGHQIMIGLPGDSFKKDLDTAKMIVQMKPKMARIYPALVIKNTAMETMYKLNKFNPYTLNEAIKISKDIYSIFIANDINVIRIGLQPTEEITYDRDLVAGPFHPSFRELVEGSLINEIIKENISYGFSNSIKIHINSKDLSKLYAYKKKFFNDMIEQIKTNKIIVVQDNNIDRNSLLLYIDENCKEIDIKEYLEIKYKEGYFNTI